MARHVKVFGKRFRSGISRVGVMNIENRDWEIEFWEPSYGQVDRIKRLVRCMLVGALADLSQNRTYAEIQYAQRLRRGEILGRYNTTRGVIKPSETPAGLAIEWILGPYCPSDAFSFPWTCEVLELTQRRILLIRAMALQAQEDIAVKP